MKAILCPNCEGPRFEVDMAPVGVFRNRVVCLFCSHCGGKLPFNAQGTYDITEELYKTTGPDVLKKAVLDAKEKIIKSRAALVKAWDALETESEINKQDQKQIEEKYGIEL